MEPLFYRKGCPAGQGLRDYHLSIKGNSYSRTWGQLDQQFVSPSGVISIHGFSPASRPSEKEDLAEMVAAGNYDSGVH